MRQFLGRITIQLASLAALSTAAQALGDAPAWVGSMPGGPQVTLSMSSIEGADSSLRDLARSAQIDWLPTAGRLLSSMNLSPGIDTSRPIAFGFRMEDATEGERLRFLAVLPAERPSAIAANFEALPSPEHPGLFAFEFADRSYFARVLPDDHLAISDSPNLLLALPASGVGALEPQASKPISLTLHGDRSLVVLAALIEGSGLAEQPLAGLGEDSAWPEGVRTISLDAAPSSDLLSLAIRIEAEPESEQAQRWQTSETVQLGAVPFPQTDAMVVMQGSTADPVMASILSDLAEGLLGIDAGTIAAADSVALLVDAPANILEFSNISVSLALTTDAADELRAAIAGAIERRSGAVIARNASTRAGVSIDRFRLSGAPDRAGQRDGVGRLLPNRRSEGGQIDGRMFTRNGRLYLTSSSTEEGLDRLIAFGPDSDSIDASEFFEEPFSRLPAGSGGRLALNIRPLATASVIGAGFQGGRIELPQVLPPVVASLRTHQSGIEATIIAPAQAIQLLNQVRRVAGEIDRNRRR
jgi:hypothetical protein